MWRYVALSQNLKKQSFSPFLPFLLFSANLQKTGVALCGAMWRYVALSQNLKKHSFFQFLPFLLFSANLQKQAWRYVALCGAIPKFEKTKFFSIFAVFAVFSKSPKNRRGAMWRYVALCGAIPKFEKTKFFFIFAVFSQFWKKRGVALCGGIPESEKTGVSTKRRRALWRCPKIAIFSKCKKQSWGYVVYPKKYLKTKLFSMLFLLFSTPVSKILVALCGGCPTLRNDHVFHFGING